MKEIGALLAVSFHDGVEAFTSVLFRDVLHWSQEEVHVFNAKVREAVKRKDAHPIFDFVVVTGRKPLAR